MNNCKYCKADCALRGEENLKECKGHIPMTNADRIRSMSDEELENGIRKLSVGYEPWCDRHCKMYGDDNCNRCLRIWLQKPAERG